MSDLQQISHDLVKRLSLRYEPVGITLYKETDTLPGLGCRLKSSIEPCDLMLGSPGDQIDIIHRHILDMEKPIGMLAKAHTGT